MERLLEAMQGEFKEGLSIAPIFRRYQWPETKNAIKIALGMRRSGKTSLLYQMAREKLAQGVPLERFLYLNFADDRLLPLDHSMGQLIEKWYSLYPENLKGCCYLFLDEVQNVEVWPLVLRRLLDTKEVEIYVTATSANLLTSEIAAALKSRSFSIEILPYSYEEHLLANQLEKPTKPFGKKVLDYHRAALQGYLRKGGFPGIQTKTAQERIEALQSYVEMVIFRDIVKRHQISNISLLKFFIHFLLKCAAEPFSINKFYHYTKAQGFKVGKDTLHAYLAYLEEAFLIFTVPIFTDSQRKSETTAKKIYVVDSGLIAANTYQLENLSRLFENQVYLDLRRQGKKIFYYPTVDFITEDNWGRQELIQTCFDESGENAERKKRLLEKAERELGIPGRLLDFNAYLSESHSAMIS